MEIERVEKLGKGGKDIAIFGMGCFWKPQQLFEDIEGVLKTEVGFMGGSEEFEGDELDINIVYSQDTGHVEVIKVEFNPRQIEYEELLDIFWQNHDATQKNRQGVDIGSQYQSTIFYLNESQKRKAEKAKKEVQEMIGTDRKVETEIRKVAKFYRAEEEQQDYLEKNPGRQCYVGSTFK